MKSGRNHFSPQAEKVEKANEPAAWNRDWRWLSRTPPLMEASPLPDWLVEALSGPLRETAPLHRFFEGRSHHRVGLYTEALMAAALEGAEAIEEVRHGIPVRDEIRTIGELDFLFRHRDLLYHLELAVKFYLHDPATTGLGSHFVGPNRGDTFERKATRLLEHQLPLGRRAFPEVERSFLLCTGLIFYRLGESPPSTLPAHLSPDHGRGLWTTSGEFPDWVADRKPGARAAILGKPFWLGADPDRAISGIVPEVEEHFSRTRYPLLLAWDEGEGEDSPPGRRLFVVPDDWSKSDAES